MVLYSTLSGMHDYLKCNCKLYNQPGCNRLHFIKDIHFQTNVAEWKLVFFCSALAFFLGNIAFIVLGSGDLQPWNNPNYATGIVSHLLNPTTVRLGFWDPVVFTSSFISSYSCYFKSSTLVSSPNNRKKVLASPSGFHCHQSIN